MENLLREATRGFNEEILKTIFGRKFENFTFEEKEIFLHDKEEYRPKQIGTATLESYTIGVYTVKVEKELTEKSSKREQFEIAKKLLNQFLQDAGLFVFYNREGESFRLSLVFKEYLGRRTKFSNYKRFTFFVKAGKPNRTFLKRFLEIEWKTLRDLIETFSVEPLSKEFYKEIQTWFYWAKENVKFPSGETEHHLVRLLSRLIFVWFLKEKGLVPEEIFDEEKLKGIVKDFGKSNNYYNVILQNLFFATLNQEIDKRKFAEEGNFLLERKEFDIKNLYRYKDLLLITEEEFINLFKNTPFINGGLFECLDREKQYIDGFSRNPKKRAQIPDEVFFSEEKTIDLNKYGLGSRKVRGLIKILSSYDWTVEESTPLDVEVALDPELLGKVFENILAEINQETQEDARRQTGSYYTPKEIVNYMVEESLLYLLKEKTNIDEEKLRRLIYEEEVSLTEEEKKRIVQTVADLKIIDPAAGSGAFLVGILLKLIKILDAADPNNNSWREIQKKLFKERFEKILDAEDFKEKLRELEEDFDLTKNYPDFARKLYIIQNSLYGVDIQPVAVELTKLRFFITLLVDQKVDRKAPNLGIKPLPNLDLNFICADFLVKLKSSNQDALGSNKPQIRKLEEEIRNLSRRYFRASKYQKKKQIKGKLLELRKKLAQELEKLGFSPETAKKIADFDPFDPLKVNYWFDPEWIFEINGFDLVIGNPPYIRHERLRRIKRNGKSYKDILRKQNYKTFSGTADIYVCFYERGIEILAQGGILNFISSNKFMRAKYGEKLRKFLSDFKILEIIDFGGFRVFGATVDTAIVLVQKKKPQKDSYVLALTVPSDLDRENLVEFLRKNKTKIPQKYFKEEAWIIEDVEILKLKEKIENIGKPLGEWQNVKIYFGIKTGFNDAFIVDTQTKNEILNNCKSQDERLRTEKLFKKVLRGRDIGRYCYDWAGKWLIFIPSGWTNKHRKKQNPEEFFKQNFESLYNFFRKVGNNHRGRGKGLYNRDDQGDYWWELRPCDYYQEFEKPKIIWQEMSNKPSFALDLQGFYTLQTVYILPSQDANLLKYLIGVMNSKLSEYYIKLTAYSLSEEAFRWIKQFVEKLPIPNNPNPKLKQEIIQKVEQILKITSKGCNSLNETQKEELKKISDEIDKLVYKLYGLSEEEIKLIEKRIRG